MRACRTCGLVKAESEFYSPTPSLRPDCRVCERHRARERASTRRASTGDAYGRAYRRARTILSRRHPQEFQAIFQAELAQITPPHLVFSGVKNGRGTDVRTAPGPASPTREDQHG